MRIEFWVDYVCPITFLTHQNLLLALEELGLSENEIYYRSYPLTKEYFDVLKEKPEVIEIIQKYFPNKKGFTHFETHNIHQVAHLAKNNNLAKEFTTEILNRKFINNQNINDKSVLLEVAKSINLDVSETNRVIENYCYDKQINTNRVNAELKGIKLIPHLRINMKNNFNGFYTKDELVTHISKILNYKPKFTTECDGEVCDY